MPIKILDHVQCQAIIRRLAYQILEANYDELLIYVLGVYERGFQLARMMVGELETDTRLQLICLPLHKQTSRQHELAELNIQPGHTIVVVDDVLYTGRTMFDILVALDGLSPRSLQVATLIDRGHKYWPVAANFVGLELATTLQDYVSVTIDENTQHIEAFLE